MNKPSNKIDDHPGNEEIIFISPISGKHGVGLLKCNYGSQNIGKPFRFPTKEKLDEFTNWHKLAGAYATINGYRIIIVWHGTNGQLFRQIPPGEKVTPEILEDLNKMAAYYETTKIIGRETHLKRYKEN